jgi:hypothetical protein
MEGRDAIRLVRAVAALDGVDVVPSPQGAVIGAARGEPVPWQDVADLLGDDDPLERGPRLRLAVLAALHRRLADLKDSAADHLSQCLRPLALPVGHPLLSPRGWARGEVPGGVLTTGLGVFGLVPDSDLVLPLYPSLLRTLAGPSADRDGRTARRWTGIVWDRAQAVGEAVGGHVAARRGELTLAEVPAGIDAVTLLALPAVRRALRGLVAVPTRERVLLGEAAMDTARLRALWTLTRPAGRGVPNPLLARADRLGAIPALRVRQLSVRADP